MFVRREVFFALGGFPELELMEDIELSRRLKRVGKIACLRERVQTSARRWQRDGVLRTILLMWTLRFAYFLGVPPQQLKAFYADTR
jgi:GT2 family glycosyltransferase